MWLLVFSKFMKEWGLTLFLSLISVAISSTAGLAGGVLVLPILLFLKREKPTTAVGLRSICVFGGAIINLSHHMGERHPLSPTRTIIDWNFIIAAVPSSMLGARVGGFLNKTLPPHITLPLLTCILFVAAWETKKKATSLEKKMRRVDASVQTPFEGFEDEDKGASPSSSSRHLQVELLPISEAADSAQGPSDAHSSLNDASEVLPAGAHPLHAGPHPNSDSASSLQPSAAEGGKDASPSVPRPDDEDRSAAPSDSAAHQDDPSRPLLSGHPADSAGSVKPRPMPAAAWPPSPRPLFQFAEGRAQPLKEICVIAALTLSLILLDLVGMRTPCGGGKFWVLEAVSICFILITINWAYGRLLERAGELSSEGQVPLDGDIVWNRSTAVRIPLLFVMVGFLQGTLGGGGGLIQAPVMLKLKMRPDVTRATSLTMIFFTSVASASIYFAMGEIPTGLSAIFAVIGFLGTEFAQFMMHHLRFLQGDAQKIKLVHLMAILIFVGASLTGVRALVEADKVNDKLVPMWHFHKLCRNIEGE